MSHPTQALFTAQFNNHLGIPVYIIRRDPPPFSLWSETVLKKGLIVTQLREEPPLTQYMASSPEDSREGLSPARRGLGRCGLWGPSLWDPGHWQGSCWCPEDSRAQRLLMRSPSKDKRTLRHRLICCLYFCGLRASRTQNENLMSQLIFRITLHWFHSRGF